MRGPEEWPSRGAIRRTEFGLQVRLPQVLIFNHLQNTGSRCDAGVTQLNGIGRKLGLRSLENRLAYETGKTPTTPHYRLNFQNAGPKHLVQSQWRVRSRLRIA
jgi:hypothetical protein